MNTRIRTLHSKEFSRRALVVGGIQGAAFAALTARLYFLQFMKADELKDMAEGNRIRIYPEIPRRGRFIDRTGAIVAESQPRYQALYDPAPKSNREEVLLKLAFYLKLDAEHTDKLLAKGKSKRTRFPLLVHDYLTWEQLAILEVNTPDLPGVFISVPDVRYYPYAEKAAHLFGYTGIMSEHDIEKFGLTSAIYRYPDFRVGKAGLEVIYDATLRGEPGVRQVEVNARGAQVRQLESVKGKVGEDLHLTIDMELQAFLMDQLKGKGGKSKEGASAVIMEVSTGNVLAMGSVPSYDPNRFARGIDPVYWKQLMEDIDAPLSFRAISMQCPPGSTFKVFSAMAALHHGEMTPDTKVHCPGYFDIGGRRFHCWNHDGHGTVDLHRAIQVSCNVYFYTIAKKLGVDRIADMARQFGLGLPSGLNLPGERNGLIPDTKWKREKMKDNWYLGETLNTGIGQGYMQATPLQLCTAMSRLANGGTKVKPRLTTNEPLPEFEHIDVKPEYFKEVLFGMDMAVNVQGGTGYNQRITDERFRMGGKTGTAQVVNRTFKDLPANKWERHHALFVGFAPTQAPKYAIAVIVDHGGYGGMAAAPVGRAVLLKAQRLDLKYNDPEAYAKEPQDDYVVKGHTVEPSVIVTDEVIEVRDGEALPAGFIWADDEPAKPSVPTPAPEEFAPDSVE